MTSATTGSAEGAGAVYVYGIVPEKVTHGNVGDLPAVGDETGDARVEFVRDGDIAAVISPLSTRRPLGTPEDLTTHARVLDAFAAQGSAVLPFRFGSVLDDRQAVATDLLAGGHEAFQAGLGQLGGRAQFTLRAVYEQKALLGEVLEEHPDIATARSAVSGLPEEAAYYEKVRLGEMVAEAVEAKRAADTEEIMRRLEPVSVAAVTAQSAEEDGVCDASFLVDGTRRDDFEHTTEELARSWHGRIRLRLLGPLAPYDFVAEAMGAPGTEEG